MDAPIPETESVDASSFDPLVERRRHQHPRMWSPMVFPLLKKKSWRDFAKECFDGACWWLSLRLWSRCSRHCRPVVLSGLGFLFALLPLLFHDQLDRRPRYPLHSWWRRHPFLMWSVTRTSGSTCSCVSRVSCLSRMWYSCD